MIQRLTRTMAEDEEDSLFCSCDIILSCGGETPFYSSIGRQLDFVHSIDSLNVVDLLKNWLCVRRLCEFLSYRWRLRRLRRLRITGTYRSTVIAIKVSQFTVDSS